MAPCINLEQYLFKLQFLIKKKKRPFFLFNFTIQQFILEKSYKLCFTFLQNNNKNIY